MHKQSCMLTAILTAIYISLKYLRGKAQQSSKSTHDKQEHLLREKQRRQEKDQCVPPPVRLSRLRCATFDWIWIASPDYPEAIYSCLRRECTRGGRRLGDGDGDGDGSATAERRRRTSAVSKVTGDAPSPGP